MGLAIVFRPRPLRAGTLPFNPFNALLTGGIAASRRGSEILIASGFFQENGYCASQEPGLITALNTVGAHLITVGTYSYGRWENSYRNFIRATVGAFRFRFDALLKDGRRWHTKALTIHSPNGNPLFAIVGSSNITSPAFGTNGPRGNPTKGNNTFNWECDVVLWSDRDRRMSRFMTEFINVRQEENPQALIVARYDAAENAGQTIEDRIRSARDEILGDAFPYVGVPPGFTQIHP